VSVVFVCENEGRHWKLYKLEFKWPCTDERACASDHREVLPVIHITLYDSLHFLLDTNAVVNRVAVRFYIILVILYDLLVLVATEILTFAL
jgi:hypothetical protein